MPLKKVCFLMACTPFTWNMVDLPEPRRLSTFLSSSCFRMEWVSGPSHFGRGSFAK